MHQNTRPSPSRNSVISNVKVNDNRWHDVSILRPVVQKHVLRVDGYSVEDNVMDSRALHFDLDEKLFIGGTERLRYGQMPAQVKVRRGFVGCLASVDINGDIHTLTDHRIHLPPEHRLAVRDGCHGKSYYCSV
jgi:neurexin